MFNLKQKNLLQNLIIKERNLLKVPKITFHQFIQV
jgi:hypothetical protein